MGTTRLATLTFEPILEIIIQAVFHDGHMRAGGEMHWLESRVKHA